MTRFSTDLSAESALFALEMRNKSKVAREVREELSEQGLEDFDRGLLIGIYLYAEGIRNALINKNNKDDE